MFAIPHIEMIVAAYVLTAIVVALMIGFVWLDHKSLTSQLAALERKSDLK